MDQAAKKLNLPVSVVDEVEETAKKSKASPFCQNDVSSWKRNQQPHRIKILGGATSIVNFLRKRDMCCVRKVCGFYSGRDGKCHAYLHLCHMRFVSIVEI